MNNVFEAKWRGQRLIWWWSGECWYIYCKTLAKKSRRQRFAGRGSTKDEAFLDYKDNYYTKRRIKSE